jgi:L-ascorbate metabolism protein UlaG (beta-lactamase superfamily)
MAIKIKSHVHVIAGANRFHHIGSIGSSELRDRGIVTMVRPPRISQIGGPTVLIEIAGLRLLTDPTFDPPGEYRLPHVVLRKVTGPARSAKGVGPVDAVLLSHDQHADNLDHSGREFLTTVARVFTTRAGAARLGGRAVGLAPWEPVSVTAPDGGELEITATPARHGPAGIEPLSGDVIGFVLTMKNDRNMRPIYITGDTVWYDGVAEVARRFDVGLVLLFAGAAQTRGPFHLTMDTNDAIEAAHAFPNATIVPVHIDSWAHLTQSAQDLTRAFEALGLAHRITVIAPGDTWTWRSGADESSAPDRRRSPVHAP